MIILQYISCFLLSFDNVFNPVQDDPDLKNYPEMTAARHQSVFFNTHQCINSAEPYPHLCLYFRF